MLLTVQERDYIHRHSFGCNDWIGSKLARQAVIKVCFISRSIQSVDLFTLHPLQTCSFRHQLDFSGKNSSDAAITCED